MNENLLNRYSNLLSRQGQVFEVYNNVLYYNYNGIIMPFAPANESMHITNKEANIILGRLGGKILRWTEGNFSFDDAPEWYATICTRFQSIDQVKSKLRAELKKGLSNCIVQPIDEKYLAKYAYEIYLKALTRYANSRYSPESIREYTQNILAGINFDDIHQFWGVFVQRKLIGYSSVYVFDKTEALYSAIKIDPEYLQYHPSHALIYKMNEHYLQDLAFSYVNDGYRSLLHNSSIQNFLIKQFNFVKAGLPLRIFYKPPLNLIVRCLYPVRNLVSTLDPRIKAVLEMERIRRSYVQNSSEI